MKQIEVKNFDEQVVIEARQVNDDAVVDVECGYVRIADQTQCILISTVHLESIAIVPAEKAKYKTAGDCGCDCHTDDTCKCVDCKEQFDCKGACKNRCFECKHQDDIIAGSATPFIGEDGGE